jgi:hypothetical protein
MTTTGQDIADVLAEVGTRARVLNSAGEVLSEEYLQYSVNIRTSNPFHREFFLETMLPHNTNARPGAIVEFVSSGRKNIVMSSTPKTFEDEVVLYNSVIYKCNVSGELLRMQKVEGENPYHTVPGWQPVQSPCFGALIESNYDNALLVDEEIGHVTTEELFLYVPSSVIIQPEDRYVPVSGETPYRVGIVKRFAYEGTDVAVLKEDTRP